MLRNFQLRNLDPEISKFLKEVWESGLNQFENLPITSSLAPRLILKNSHNKGLFFKKYINLFLYNEPNPKPGTISKSTFDIPPNLPLNS